MKSGMNSYDLIRSISSDDIKLVKEFDVGMCRVEVWQEVNAMPPQRFTLAVCSDGRYFLPRMNDEEFKKAVESMRLSQDDLNVFISEFRYLAPGRRTVIEELRFPYQQSISEEWHPPALSGDCFVFYVDNPARGILEKFTIHELCRMQIDECKKVGSIFIQ